MTNMPAMKTVLAALAVCGLFMFTAGTAHASSCAVTSEDGTKHCSVSCPRNSYDEKNGQTEAKCGRSQTLCWAYCAKA